MTSADPFAMVKECKLITAIQCNDQPLVGVVNRNALAHAHTNPDDYKSWEE